MDSVFERLQEFCLDVPKATDQALSEPTSALTLTSVWSTWLDARRRRNVRTTWDRTVVWVSARLDTSFWTTVHVLMWMNVVLDWASAGSVRNVRTHREATIVSRLVLKASGESCSAVVGTWTNAGKIFHAARASFVSTRTAPIDAFVRLDSISLYLKGLA